MQVLHLLSSCFEFVCTWQFFVRDMFEFICMLLWPLGLWRFFGHNFLFSMLLLPSGLCGCLFVRCLSLFACCSCHRGFADAFGHMFGFCFACCSCHRGFADAFGHMFEFCFAYCSCHRGFADAFGHMFEFCFACCSCHRGFADAFGHMFEFVCMLLLPSELYRCFWPHV